MKLEIKNKLKAILSLLCYGVAFWMLSICVIIVIRLSDFLHNLFALEESIFTNKFLFIVNISLIFIICVFVLSIWSSIKFIMLGSYFYTGMQKENENENTDTD